VDPSSTPWRVFDAPSPSPAGGAPPAAPSGTGPSSSPGTDSVTVRLPPPTVVLAIAGAAVVGVLALVLALTGAGAGAVIDGPGASGRVVAGSGAPLGGEVVVDVAGAVARPGVYRLSTGSRVGDAIGAAGGYGPRVAADRVGTELNLAALLQDGMRIVVPSRDDAAVRSSAAPGGAPVGAQLVDLNQATAEELDSLPGIGPVTADKIIAARQEAPFKTVDELRERGLVGQKTFEKLRPLVTVG